MSDFNPLPEEATIEKVHQQWKERTDTFGRVYYVIIGTSEFTHFPLIAESANCSPNSAKKHLERLVDMGLIERCPNTVSARYRRNEAYFEWYEANQIAADLTIEEMINQVRQLESRQKEFEDRFDSDDPATVPVFSPSSHETIHERMKVISEWQSLKRDLHLYELAHRIAENDGHLLPL